MIVAAAGTVLQGGRAKAYRPLPAADRRRAFDAALAAYERGDFFEAHELLEPAWMGTDDLAERALHQGLIKLAAAFVHGVRGNPPGIAKNLARRPRAPRGARSASPPAAASGLDLAALVAAIDDRLARLARRPDRRRDRRRPPCRGARPMTCTPGVPSISAARRGRGRGPGGARRTRDAAADRRRPRARRVRAGADRGRRPPADLAVRRPPRRSCRRTGRC